MQSSTAESSESQKSLAAALGRIPSGLFIITFRHGSDETAMLASWVQQCSFEPPQVVIAINEKRYVLNWLERNAAITVNILGEGQKDLVAHFGKGFELHQPAFKGIKIERSSESAPALAEAHATLECRVTGKHRASDHYLIVAEVIGGKLRHDGRPAVHIRRNGLSY